VSEVYSMSQLDRRDFLKRAAAMTTGLMGAGLLQPRQAAAEPPVSPVAVRACKHYDRALIKQTLGRMFGDLGGLSGLVSGRKVGIKLNLTSLNGNVQTQHGVQFKYSDTTHPDVAYALAQLMIEAGAERVKFLESSYSATLSVEPLFASMGYNVPEFRALGNGSQVDFHDTRAAGEFFTGPHATPNGGSFNDYWEADPLTGAGAGPSYLFNKFYMNKWYSPAECDVFVSLAKQKGHDTCGVTLSSKNLFGCWPLSVYGSNATASIITDDRAGGSGPEEARTFGRSVSGHNGGWDPLGPVGAKLASEHGVSTYEGNRMPRLIVDLIRARPIHIAVIDGIMGSQPAWGPTNNSSVTTPGILVAGFNPICADAVCVGIMGQDPQAADGTGMFLSCKNYLNLAADKQIGSNDLSRIPIVGDPIWKVRYDYYPHVKKSGVIA